MVFSSTVRFRREVVAADTSNRIRLACITDYSCAIVVYDYRSVMSTNRILGRISCFGIILCLRFQTITMQGVCECERSRRLATVYCIYRCYSTIYYKFRARISSTHLHFFFLKYTRHNAFQATNTFYVHLYHSDEKLLISFFGIRQKNCL